MVKISIIMPVYNGYRFLIKSIESVSNQTLKDIELICVDDGSTDKSLERLNELKEKYDFIKVISQDNQGSGKARNTGLDKATGEYIAFLDADDIFIDENALEKMYDAAINNNSNIVSANLQFITNSYKIKDNPHYFRGDYNCFYDESEISPNDYGIPYAFYKNIFKKEFLDSNNIRFPDLLRGQDPVFLSEVFANTETIHTLPLNLYGYNYSIGGGVNKKVNNYEKKESYIKHFKLSCDILKEANLTEISNQYKTHFSKYLNWDVNNLDEDIFKIFKELFSIFTDYFDDDDENFQMFNIGYSSFNLYHSDSQDYYNEIKDKFSTLNVEDYYSISPQILKRYLIILKSSSLEEYKLRFRENYMKYLKDQNNELLNINQRLNSDQKVLLEEIEDVKEFNDSLFNSSSWKITKPIRGVKNMFK